MTDAEYIELRAEHEREKARWDLKSPFHVRPFSEVLEKRDHELIGGCLGVIEYPKEYTVEEVEQAAQEMKERLATFDAVIEEMKKEKKK